jgi:hypothetical protein
MAEKSETNMINNLPTPSTRNLTLAYILSLIVALLMTAASLAGLLFQSVLYPTDELRQSFVSNDVVNLFIGLPILLGSMWLTRRGRLIGLLFWPGALFYVAYNSIAYSIAMPFTLPFWPNLALVVLSVTTMVGLLSSMDAVAIRGRLEGVVPERFAGGVLAGFGILFFFMRVGIVAQALTGQGQNGPEVAVAVTDLLIMPFWVIGGILLWRRQAFGYVTGAGLLFQASMLFVGLLVFFILQPFIAAVPFPIADFVIILVMGMVCFIPFGLFVRGILSVKD